MAKAKKTKAIKKVEEHIIKPTPILDAIEISFSKEELATFANLMSICAQTFENLAQQATKANEGDAALVLSARQKLSNMYAYKLLSSYSVGEPESRDVH
jgi:hypothetical protein